MAILQQQSSDVRFNELDLSQTLTQASSATAAIVLASPQGRLGIFHVTSPDTFLDEYGIPTASVSFGHYCALDFLREGNSLYVNRVAGSGYAYADALLYTRSGTMGLASGASAGSGLSNPLLPSWSMNYNGYTYSSGTDSPLVLFYPKRGPGKYANAKIGVQLVTTNLNTPSTPTATASTSVTQGTLSAATYTYKVAALSPSGETVVSAAATATTSGSNGIVILTWPAVSGAIGYKIYGRTGTQSYMVTVGTSSVNASGVPTWTDYGSIVPSGVAPITNGANVTLSTSYTLNVYDLSSSSSIPVETYPVTLTDAMDSNGVQTEIAQRVNPYSQYISLYSNVSALVTVPTLTGQTAVIPLDGGLDGSTVTNSQIQLGWEAFREREFTNVDILLNGGVFDVGVQQNMNAIAIQRATAIALLDVPSSSQSTAQAMIDYRNLTLNINSSYSALFGPDVLESDPYNGKSLYVPFSGWAGALCARTDRVADAWWSIAGLNRGLVNVQGVRYKYGDADRTSLFKAQVNYTRNFLGAGIALWEQVTLQAKQSALSWINVRRLCNIIKKSVYTYLIYALEEPNDDFLRAQIIDAISQYLSIIQDNRGLSNFLVVASNKNNPPSLTNAGILRISVFITPIIATHEIQLDLIITKQGVTFSEINLANLGG